MNGVKQIVRKLRFFVFSGGLMLLFSVSTKAQQDPVYTQYMNNLMSVNPAYTGVRGVGSTSMLFRKQWMNFNGSPISSSITLGLPIDSLHIGAGFDFLYDNIGPLTTTAIFLDYSYRIQITESTQLSFGLKGGFNFVQANLKELYRHDYDDQYILEYGDFSRLMPNFGIGLFWFSKDFYVGLAIPRLLQNKYYKDVTIVEAANREERHYFLNGAYQFRLSEQIVFKPGITTILVAGAPATADFDLSFMYMDKFWFGAMYRISDALGAYVQLQVQENLKIGFSYEYPHTSLNEFNNGTIEVMLRYDFKTKSTQLFPFAGF